MTERPNPVECDPPGFDLVDTVQRLRCRHRGVCLVIAGSWRSFSCGACGAYAPQDVELWRAEIVPLAGLGRLVARLSVASDAELPPGLRSGREVDDEDDDQDQVAA